MRTLVVVNPNASTTTPRSRDVLLAALHDRLSVEVVVTERRDHATALAAKARKYGWDLVLAHGGDGTVNEVVNGLLREGPGDDVPLLGIVPGGRTNVLARNLGIPNDPVEATGAILALVRDGTTRRIGLGRVGQRWFTFNAGVGLDAAVVHAVERHRDGGKVSSQRVYVQSAFTEYFRSARRTAPVTLRIPGEADVAGLHMVVVSNCSPWTYLGGRGVHVSPEASFDTGLDVAALRPSNAVKTLRHGAEILSTTRGPRGGDVVRAHDLAALELISRAPIALQVDGDYLGTTAHAQFQSVPNALAVIA